MCASASPSYIELSRNHVDNGPGRAPLAPLRPCWCGGPRPRGAPPHVAATAKASGRTRNFFPKGSRLAPGPAWAKLVLLPPGPAADSEPARPPRVAAFRDGLNDFVDEESRLDTGRVAPLAENRQRQQLVLIGAVLGSMLIWALTAFVVVRHFGRRVEVLIDNAERLGNGQTLAAPLSGGDEIAALDAVLHQTGARLRLVVHEHSALKDQLQARARERAIVNQDMRQGT